MAAGVHMAPPGPRTPKGRPVARSPLHVAAAPADQMQYCVYDVVSSEQENQSMPQS